MKRNKNIFKIIFLTILLFLIIIVFYHFYNRPTDKFLNYSENNELDYSDTYDQIIIPYKNTEKEINNVIFPHQNKNQNITHTTIFPRIAGSCAKQL